MSSQSLQLIKALSSDNKDVAQAAFLAAISEKVKQALDVRRIQVASQIYPAK